MNGEDEKNDKGSEVDPQSNDVQLEEPNINDKTAYIFAYFIREHLSQLKEITKEIDNEYSN